MNILIISENFLKGGLETYLYTMYNELKNKNNIYFCFGKFDTGLNIDKKSIITDFKFSPNSSISEFINDVNKLIEIIHDKKIDLIIANPFYSLFPTVFAANITNTKIVYLYHGMGSLNFPDGYIDSILFRYSFETTVKKVFCVTKQGIEAFKRIGYNESIFLPNPIDGKLYKKNTVKLNKKWVLISRLDNDKLSDIINFLNILPNLDIDKVDIFGEGTEKDYINDYIDENKLKSKVELKGYSAQINEDIENKYTGVIGIGRVVIEGLAMNYPVFLIGYNKIVGVINQNIYEKLHHYNFVPNYCDSLELKEIQKQIKDINKGDMSEYQFRTKIISDFGIKNFVKKFKEETINIEFYNKQNIVNLFYEIKKLNNKNYKNNYFYSSIEVYNLMKKYIAVFTNDFNIKTNFIMYNKIIENNLLINNINNEKDAMINEIEYYKININNIYNSTSWKITKPLRQFKILIQKFNILDRNKK
ncbi:MAG: glycosyltransferase [Bacilli bacterium]|nr:glycosyltransferase [Bacilli bacterium]MDD4406961.1 glycosyltransferase [Bacilli bacterium]